MKTTTILHLSICLGSSLLCVGQAPTQTKSSAPIAIVGGKPILEQEVLDSVGRELAQLRQQEYDLKSKALESLLRHALVDAEARKRGISAQELIEKEVDSKVPDPADAEVEAYFWGQNRAGVHLEDVKEQFRANLKQVRLQKARQAYADSLRPKTDVAILLRPPSIDVAWDPARVRGDVNAPVTIVEFADFQCPFCKKGEETIKNLLAKYSGRVKWAYRDFPLQEIHPQAWKAAEAARCAGDQGKFWEYHDALFAEQSKLDDISLLARARNLKLDETAFQACLAGGKFRSSIEADVEQGGRVGVAGTPAYFINGVFLSGAQPEGEFEKVIKNELSLPRSHSEP